METAAERLAFMVDFGVTATVGSTSVTGLLDATHEYSGDAVLTDYWLTVPKESASIFTLRSTATVDGASYTVLAVLPDGTGMVKVRMDKV